MNTHFSLIRFWFLCKKYFTENRKTILLYISGLFIFLMVIYGLIILSSLHSTFPATLQSALFITGLLLGGCIFSSAYYGFFSNKPKAIQFLNLPASVVEKFMLGFMVTQIFYFIVFIILFIVTDQLMCSFYNDHVAIPSWVLPYDRQISFKATPLDIFGDPNNQIYLMFFFFLSAFMQLGSLSFEKNAFITTSLFIILIFASIAFLNTQLLALLIPEEIVAHGKFFNDSFRLDDGKNIKGIVALPEITDQILSLIIPLLVFIFCWTAIFFRLKEKQV